MFRDVLKLGYCFDIEQHGKNYSCFWLHDTFGSAYFQHFEFLHEISFFDDYGREKEYFSD